MRFLGGVSLGFETLPPLGQLGPVELPVEWPGLTVCQLLVKPEPSFDFRQTGEIVGREDFSLDLREVNLHLIQPTRMDGSVDQDGSGVRLHQPLDRSRASMRRAVVHYPEDSIR